MNTSKVKITETVSLFYVADKERDRSPIEIP